MVSLFILSCNFSSFGDSGPSIVYSYFSTHDSIHVSPYYQLYPDPNKAWKDLKFMPIYIKHPKFLETNYFQRYNQQNDSIK